MKARAILTIAAGLLAAASAMGQSDAPPLPPPAANPAAPSLQANADPGYDAVLAACKNPPAKMPPIKWPATGPAASPYT
ncbi:MAG TPA: hypothetical protein VMM16_08600, partial [Verrucomicrobiae bacterium]|nr:hypothetical protein [Verrucomicrobiae bacterium]